MNERTNDCICILQEFVLGDHLSILLEMSSPIIPLHRSYYIGALQKHFSCMDYTPPTEEPSIVSTFCFVEKIVFVCESIYLTKINDLHRYMESIVSLRQLQKTLQNRSHADTKTRLWEWMHESWQHYTSLLPVYFDRVLVTAQPLYQFQTTEMTCERDARIWQFLRQQEKLGGPATAVAVVLDAVGTQNLHVERGFVLGNGNTSNSTVTPKSSSGLTTDARIIWPAVYLRNSLFLSSDRSSGVASNSGSRSSSRNSFGALAPPTRPSLSNLGSNASTAAAAASGKQSSSMTSKLLQYGADADASATQWPHTEWASLASCLAETTIEEDEDESLADSTLTGGAVLSVRMAHEPTAATFREDAGSLVKQPALDSLAAAMKSAENQDSAFWKFIPGLSNVWKAQETSQETDSSRRNSFSQLSGLQGMALGSQTSTFHVVSLSSFLSLVVIVKPDALDGNFLRRRSRLNDEEIQDFLNTMAENLRVSQRFLPRCLPKQHKRGRQLSDSLLDLPTEVVADEMVMSVVLRRVKGAFGLGPSSPLQNKHRGFSILPQQRPKGYSSRGDSSVGSESNASFTESAAALFLGDDLAGLMERV